MKHVREDLPDVQAARPEVSARLAAVLDRMTDKDLAHRYPDARALEADLEDALAAEAARTGTLDRRGDRGPAHAAGRRAPPRSRSGCGCASPCCCSSLMIAVAGARRRTCCSTRPSSAPSAAPAPGTSTPPPGEQIVSVKRTSAPRLRPARRRRGARRRGAARRRPGPRHRVDDRELPERHAHQADRQARRRPLHRRRAVGERPPARDPDARARLADGDLRRRATTPPDEWPSDDWTKVGGGTVESRKQTLQARHRRPPLPLLPRLDHEAAARRATTSRSPSSRSARRK